MKNNSNVNSRNYLKCDGLNLFSKNVAKQNLHVNKKKSNKIIVTISILLVVSLIFPSFSANTPSASAAPSTIFKIQSGLVTSDSLTTGNFFDWTNNGSAADPAINAPHSQSENSTGYHIGIVAPSAGIWAGWFAITPDTSATLFHAKIRVPDAKPITGVLDTAVYVQQEMFQDPRIDAMGCGADTFPTETHWTVSLQAGDKDHEIINQSIYTDDSPNQPTTRECTLITNGSNQLTAYIDGQKVFSSNKMNLNMPAPFQYYLELQTNSNTPSTGSMFTGSFTDYYATTSENVKVRNAGAGSIVRIVNATSGSVLASGTADSSGTAFVDVGRYHMPINANVRVFDAAGVNILATTPSSPGIYGGDVYDVGTSIAPATMMTVKAVDMTGVQSSPNLFTTIQNGTTTRTGFTPVTFNGFQDRPYIVSVSNFIPLIFDHWDDGTKISGRIITPTTSAVNLTAYFRNATLPNPPISLTSTTQYTTNVVTPTILGTATPGNSVQLFDGPTPTASPVTVMPNGTWSVTTPSLTVGNHILYANAKLGSDVSTTSTPITMTIDTVNPSVSISGNTQSNRQVTLTGTSLDDGSGIKIVEVSVDNSPTFAKVKTSIPADLSAWSFTTGQLVVGSHHFIVRATDMAGNRNTSAIDIQVTNTPIIIMSDTTASFASLISAPRQFIGELTTPTSVLVGKHIDSITLKLQKVGAPTGVAQVGVFDINRNVVKLFGTIDVSTISTTATDYEFKLLSTDPLYTIQSGDRIGIKYTGGSATVGVNVTPDRDAADPFDGANSYRVRYEAAWITSTTEDMYMILKQTGSGIPTPTILLSPTIGPVGTTVNISGSGFNASSNIKIKYDNTKIAFGSDRTGDYEIYTTNADGTGQTRLTNAAHDDINPSFSPNGTKIAFESGRDGHSQIYVMNSNGSSQTRLTNNGAFDLSPSFSPNGTKIVFHTIRDGNNEIYIMNTDGSAQTRLTNNLASDKHPVFSPDGKKIVFSSDRDGNDEIYIMNTNGTGQTRLTNNVATDISPTFSPDGTKIAFASNRDGNYEIYIMNTNGSGQTRLTNNAGTDLAPSFSPDGTKIAFHSDRDANNEIYIMNVNGSGQTPLSNNLSSDTSPSFSYTKTGLIPNPSSITTNSTGGFSATFSVPSSTGGIHIVSAIDAALHTGSKTFTVPLPASISINPTAGPITSTVTVTGTQYATNSHVTIKYDNTIVTTNPSSITSSGIGGFSATFTVPSSAVGAHVINASDAASHYSTRLYAVNSSAVISLNPTTGPTGSTVTVKGTQYDTSSQIAIKYDGTPVTTNPSSVTSNSTGGFSATFSVPSSTTGLHTVSASDAALHLASKPFTVTGSGSGTFHMQTVLSGFNQPVKITFIPDNGYGVDGSGNAFVSQRTGDVIVMKYTGGQFVKQSIPFVTVPNVFSTFYEEGLAGIAFPPDYNTSHFVYFYAAVLLPGNVHKIQVMRYNVTTDGSQNIVAVPGSQKVILAFDDLGIGHFGGHIKFDSSGNLYIGAGDQWTGGASASLQTLKGKLLRITPLANPGPDGKYYSIPSTNPFASSSDPSIMKEIFSYGLRHPFSFDLDSVTGKLYVDDVGLDTCEEIDDSTVAKNFGWGTYEGPVVGNPQNLVNYKNPTYYYYHADVEAPGGGFVAITAGVFYNGDVYPSQFKGAYFFGDYGVGFIKALLPVESYPPTLDPATGVLKGQVVPITSGHPNNPVGLAVWHGEVYYTDYNGNIGKLTFS